MPNLIENDGLLLISNLCLINGLLILFKWVFTMSRAIPAPIKAKKKAPPPPRPFQNLTISQTVPFDEPEQERPEKLSPSPQTFPNTQNQQETAQYIGSVSSQLKNESNLVTSNIIEATREAQAPPTINPSEKEGSEEPQVNFSSVNNQSENLSNEIRIERASVQSATSSFQAQVQEYKPTPSAYRKAPLPPTTKGKPIKKVPPPPSRAYPTSSAAPTQTIQQKNSDDKPINTPINQEPLRPEPHIKLKTELKTNSTQAQIPPTTVKSQQQETILIQSKSNPPTLSTTEMKSVPSAPKQSKQLPFRQSSPTKQSSVAQEGSSGKSSMTAKLEELRKAKERMLKEQPSDIDEDDEEQEEQQDQPDFVKEIASQESKEAPLELTANTFSAKTKQEINQAEANHLSVKNAPSPSTSIPPPRTPPNNKKIVPPPIKNIPNHLQVKQDNPAPEKQQTSIVAEAPQIIEVKKEEQKRQQVEEKPIQVPQKKVIVNTKIGEEDNQSEKLLNRYHTLKTGYLNNLRQLDELLHFQKQQEDNQIEKINHRLAELHRRNTTLKQICSTQKLPPADTEELLV